MSARARRLASRSVVWIGAAAWALAGAQAQEPPLSDPEQATRLLRELVQVESALLADAENERGRSLADLRRAANQLARASAELTAAVGALGRARAQDGEVEGALADFEAADARLVEAEREVERLIGESRRFGRRIQDHADRLDGLRQRLRSLEAEAPAKGPLEGVWDLTVGPIGDTGTLTLRQFGTLISGRYVLGSGRDGSVRGTFVDGRVQFEVIDSRHGRDANFHGVWAPQRATISGTWESIRLGTGRPAFGDWKAVKRPLPVTGEPEPEP